MPSFQFQNYSFEFILLASSILLTLSVIASRISSKFGIPVLLFFLAIGMLAGSEGPGSIDFSNYSLAFAVGSVCLAIILFDGGSSTSWKKVRPILPLATSLSFVGTVATGLITGVFARYAFDLPWVGSMLLGAIISSTDAAAVFGILRARNLSITSKLKQTLEFEAGSNDPVAIFLTVGMLIIAANEGNEFLVLIKLFFMQAGLGLSLGLLGGWFIKWIINSVGIEYEGLYGVLLIGLIICLFGVTSTLGGSGFLASYVAGLYIGNADFLHKGSAIRFLDGMAWIAQIIVFLTLGLLVYPSHLLPLWKEGLILSFFMMFVARPLSVFLAAPGKSLPKNERLFVSWVGLRGAAPVILAALPWSVGFPNAEYYFNLVFFVVLLSVITQGITIPWVAEKAGVTVPLQEKPSAKLSAGLLPAGFINVEIIVKKNTPADNKKIVELSLPSGTLLTSLERSTRYVVPRGDTVIMANDKIWALTRPSTLDSLKNLFGDVQRMS